MFAEKGKGELMDSYFDRSRCINNIYFLTKQKGLTLGELEKSIEASQGYLSRLKKEVTSVINVEILIKIAKKLDVGLEELIGKNFASLTETDEYILNFLEKLSRDTEDDSLIWNLEPKDELANLPMEYDDNNGEPYVAHPLFTVVAVQDGVDDTSGYPKYNNEIVYNRGKDRDFSINGNCFYVNILSKTRVYVMDVINNASGSTGYDIFIQKDFNTTSLLCSSVDSPDPYFLDGIELLYSKIRRSMRRNHIIPEIKSAIDQYMMIKPGEKTVTKVAVTKVVPDDEIPF